MEIDNMSRKLKKLFPNFIIEISKEASIFVNTYNKFKPEELAINTTYVKMTGVSQKGILAFAISTTMDSYDGDLLVFPTVDKTIESIQLIQKAINETTQILNIFAKEYVPNFDEVYIKEIIQTHGEHDKGLTIEYNILYTDSHKARYTTIFLPIEKDKEIPVGKLLHDHLRILAERYIPIF